jgi:hypothetical protein
MAIKFKQGDKLWVVRIEIYKRHHEERGAFMSSQVSLRYDNEHWGSKTEYINLKDDGRFRWFKTKWLNEMEYGVPFNEYTYGGLVSRNRITCIGRTQKEAESGILKHCMYKRYLRTKERVIERMRNDLIDEQSSLVKFLGVFDRYDNKK